MEYFSLNIVVLLLSTNLGFPLKATLSLWTYTQVFESWTLTLGITISNTVTMKVNFILGDTITHGSLGELLSGFENKKRTHC